MVYRRAGNHRLGFWPCHARRANRRNLSSPCATNLDRTTRALPHRPLPETPFVSVIVCSYNGAKTLAACLESLGKLNYPSYEIILVDDGSTDNTARDRGAISERPLHSSDKSRPEPSRATPAPRRQRAKFSPTPTPTAWRIADWLYYLIGTLAERRLCRRRRAERFAAGAKLGSGLRRRRAGRAEPCSPHRHGRGTHSRL